ncbi:MULTISPECIES: hypothetical protein [Micromonospora]|uniref:Uncharacterized protein n=1 Tax=Micromonospora yangpuensis TaxID=683228 RepID=A0A1C6UGN2_9ACTN|nr:hypothetical protein [Micromonospora yangpuensis]GGM04869.1 hypothetical protein GCM10012279_23240 [Micromonospora yangpuensis]SCL53124.1 hypothetical protein GA0070617_2273 [Micromonospora yangpuensis]
MEIEAEIRDLTGQLTEEAGEAVRTLTDDQKRRLLDDQAVRDGRADLSQERSALASHTWVRDRIFQLQTEQWRPEQPYLHHHHNLGADGVWVPNPGHIAVREQDEGQWLKYRYLTKQAEARTQPEEWEEFDYLRKLGRGTSERLIEEQQEQVTTAKTRLRDAVDTVVGRLRSTAGGVDPRVSQQANVRIQAPVVPTGGKHGRPRPDDTPSPARKRSRN